MAAVSRAIHPQQVVKQLQAAAADRNSKVKDLLIDFFRNVQENTQFNEAFALSLTLPPLIGIVGDYLGRISLDQRVKDLVEGILFLRSELSLPDGPTESLESTLLFIIDFFQERTPQQVLNFLENHCDLCHSRGEQVKEIGILLLMRSIFLNEKLKIHFLRSEVYFRGRREDGCAHSFFELFPEEEGFIFDLISWADEEDNGLPYQQFFIDACRYWPPDSAARYFDYLASHPTRASFLDETYPYPPPTILEDTLRDICYRSIEPDMPQKMELLLSSLKKWKEIDVFQIASITLHRLCVDFLCCPLGEEDSWSPPSREVVTALVSFLTTYHPEQAARAQSRSFSGEAELYDKSGAQQPLLTCRESPPLNGGVLQTMRTWFQIQILPKVQEVLRSERCPDWVRELFSSWTIKA